MKNKHVKLILFFLGIFLLVIGVRSWVVVDETQYVLVTDFGRIVAVYGDDAGESGPHTKWPWQASVAIDRRIRVSEPPSREVLTGDKRNLDVASALLWRVSDPVRYQRSSGTLDAAEARLDERVAAALE